MKLWSTADFAELEQKVIGFKGLPILPAESAGYYRSKGVNRDVEQLGN
jgi:hypothetical protein